MQSFRICRIERGEIDAVKFETERKSSSETQGQIKGARESLNGRRNIYGTKKSTFLRATFSRPFRVSLVPFICPWVSEDERKFTLSPKSDQHQFSPFNINLRQSGHDNYGHDHTGWIYLIFYRLLPTTSVGNQSGQQMRIQILILEFKGLSSSGRIRPFRVKGKRFQKFRNRCGRSLNDTKER